MSDWVVSDILGEDNEVSSISPKQPAPAGDSSVSPVSPTPAPPQPVQPTEQQPTQSVPPVINEISITDQTPQPAQAPVAPTTPPVQPEPQEEDQSITHLGNSYQIKDVTVQKSGTGFPMWLLAVIIVLPMVVIFTISTISNNRSKQTEQSFLFQTLESSYFSMNFSPDYAATSIIDKKVPFLEKHDLIDDSDGEKRMSVILKDVKFDYSIDNNSLVRSRRQNSELYSEENYELEFKEGLYFKKVDENFEHLIVFVDRSKSVLYEVMFISNSNFSDDAELQKELDSLLDSFTIF